MCEAVESVRDSSYGKSASDYLSACCISCLCHHVLAYTRPLTVALQVKDCDLLKAHRMAQRLVKILDVERRGNDQFHGLWQRIIYITSILDIEPSTKRTVVRQQNRAVQVAYFNAFLDHTLQHLKTRFPEELEDALLAIHLLPGNVKFIPDTTVTRIKDEFASVLPHPTEFENEVNVWKVHMAEIDDVGEKQSQSLLFASAFAYKHHAYYPNINTILLLLLSLPVGSCSCERLFSSLRHLKTWCRNSMTNEWLDSVAISFINCEWTPSPDEVLNMWDRSVHRHIAVALPKHNMLT